MSAPTRCEEFALPDTSGDGHVPPSLVCIVEQESGGIAIRIPGTVNGDGTPVFLEWRGGYLTVHIWHTTAEDVSQSIQIDLQLPEEQDLPV